MHRKGKRIRIGFSGDGFGQRRCGQRAGGDDRRSPFGRRQAGDLLALDGDERMGFQSGGYGLRKAFTVNGQRTASGNLMGIRASHDERSGKAHLGMENTDGVGFCVVGAEGVGADELCKLFGLVRIGAANRAHFVQHDRYAGLCDLPGGFAAGKAAANDVNGERSVLFDMAIPLSPLISAFNGRRDQKPGREMQKKWHPSREEGDGCH